MQPVSERPSLRADPGGRRTQRVRRLLMVAALDAAFAVPAVADPDPEAGHDRPRLRELGLELLLPLLEVDPAPAPRTALRQRSVHPAVHDRWRGAVAVTAMSGAGLAARALRAEPRVALRERRRLPLPSPLQPLHQNLKTLQPLIPRRELRRQPVDLARQPGVLRLQVTPRRSGHTNGLTHHARSVVDPHTPRELTRYLLTSPDASKKGGEKAHSGSGKAQSKQGCRWPPPRPRARSERGRHDRLHDPHHGDLDAPSSSTAVRAASSASREPPVIAAAEASGATTAGCRRRGDVQGR